MARINRFYLFIAALVMSKAYDASAATKFSMATCYDIRNCCAPWFKKANDSGITPSDTEIVDPMQAECCESRYSRGSTNYGICVNVCGGTDSSTIDSTYCKTPDTSDSTATVDCDTASDIDVRKAELQNIDYITYSSEYANICGPLQWTDQDADGNPRVGISKCYDGDWDYDTVLFEYICKGKIGCYNYAKRYVRCDDGSGGEPSYIPPSCISGEYWNLWGEPGLGAYGGAGSCTTCPTYNYASGKYFSDLASSSDRNTDTSAAGSGGNVQFCYVPRGNVFADNSGAFEYVRDCYYGS